MNVTRSITLFSLVAARYRSLGIAWELTLLAIANLVLVASAYVSIPLPFSPVPITGQTFGLMLVAMALGRKRAAAVTAAYLLEGALGLPVFAGGAAGLQVLFGPTGGYLVGFVGAAYVTGYLADIGWDKSYWKSIGAMLVGHLIIFAAGLLQLAFFVPSNSLLAMGLTPFLLGSGIKIGLAALVLPGIWRTIGRSDFPNR